MHYINKIIYNVAFGAWYLISSLPLCIHYVFSDILCFLLFYVVRYRRSIVHEGIASSYPDKSEKDWHEMELAFYHHFCDLIVESIKYFSISEEELRRRMIIKGTERIMNSCRNGKSCGVYVGHYCNWEWMSSIPIWLDENICKVGHLYHPLENKAMDKLMGYIRSRMGAVNIPSDQSIRHILRYKKEGMPLILGFIADQVPMYRDIHYWTDFLNHDTGVFTGSERIIKMLNMDVYYLHLRRIKRGYYEGELQFITDNPKDLPDFALTEKYLRLLENNINEAPSYWLWTHRRWKRNREGWVETMRDLHREHEIEKGITRVDISMLS